MTRPATPSSEANNFNRGTAFPSPTMSSLTGIPETIGSARTATSSPFKPMTRPAKNANQDSNIIDNSLVIKVGETYLDALLKTLSERDNNYLKFETEKLTKWAEDRMNAAELAIKETKAKIKELNREAQKTVDPTAQLKIQEQLQNLQKK